MVAYDDERLELRFSSNGEDYTISCLGLPSAIHNHLVLVGAWTLLKTKKHPLSAWEGIKQGKYVRKRTKHLPKTVQAYAILNDVPEYEVWEQWKELTNEQKKEISRDKEIRKVIIDLS